MGKPNYKFEKRKKEMAKKKKKEEKRKRKEMKKRIDEGGDADLAIDEEQPAE